jgi:hypothetical protein
MSYKSRDYNTTILEAANALYHEREATTAYKYMGQSYEKLEQYIPAIISYMKYKKCAKATNKKKAQKKINALKKKVYKDELDNAISSIPKRVLISESFYKKKKIFRVRDYLYDSLGRVLEEKYNRPNASYEYRIEYQYNKYGILVDKMKFNDKDQLLETESVTYEEGKKVNELRRDSVAKFLGDSIYKYDIDGNIKEILKRDSKGDLLSKKSFLYNKGNIYEEELKDYQNPMGADNFTTRYNYEDGKLTSKEINYSSGTFEKVQYSYEKDKLIKEVFYENSDNPTRTKKYKYDAKGYLTEVSEYTVWKRSKSSLKGKVTYRFSNPLSCK